MTVNTFKIGVHNLSDQTSCDPWSTATGAQFVPAIRPITGQMILAAKYPEGFNRAVAEYKPSGKTKLCPHAANASVCPKGKMCENAGCVAELFANNVEKNRKYKTKPCKFDKDCTRIGPKWKKEQCPFVHSGELMRKVNEVAFFPEMKKRPRNSFIASTDGFRKPILF